MSFGRRALIYFLRQPTASGAIDITQPLTLSSFGRRATSLPLPRSTEPCHVLLEFGVMLLELWRGLPIEEEFANRLDQLDGDHLDRMSLA